LDTLTTGVQPAVLGTGALALQAQRLLPLSTRRFVLFSVLLLRAPHRH
jgi:hypothetical protein